MSWCAVSLDIFGCSEDVREEEEQEDKEERVKGLMACS